VTTTQVVQPTCQGLVLPQVRLLAGNWQRVVASRGSFDHGRYVTNFEDEAEEIDEDYEDVGCDGTLVMLAAERLEFRAELLAAPYDVSPIGPTPPAANYNEVARAGNKLLKLTGVTGVRFIPIRCSSSVGATPGCSAVR
jgi:hypothetical protein